MKYWQITTSRLSRSAKKLEWDSNWHAFESTPHAWYRVWHKRLVQRVNFANSEEETQLLPLVRTIEPLESMGRTGGFREEMEIQITENGFAAVVPVGYAPADPTRLEREFTANKINLRIEGNLATAVIPFERLDLESLVEVRERLALARQLFDSNK